jgi:penicillin V acylase-like amidase (Ntn superfamily)
MHGSQRAYYRRGGIAPGSKEERVREMKKIVLAFIMINVFLAGQAFSCTGIFLNKDHVKLIGRTMDWPTGDGYVSVNDSGIRKKADSLQDHSSRLEWVSKYGSVTFNMEVKLNWFVKILALMSGIKDDHPSCGLNEKGLWGGGFWIHPPPAVEYPPKDGSVSINDYQLLEYLLDTSANVEEAVENLTTVRVSGFKEGDFEADLHWFLADASGASVIIEFPNGKLQVHRNPSPPVITNSFYEHSREYLADFDGFGGGKPIPIKSGEMTTENRFLFASYMLGNYPEERTDSFDAIFDIMRTVTQTDTRHMETSQAVTQWTVVYDLENRKLSWVSRGTPAVRSISLEKIDFRNTAKKTKKIRFDEVF